ncbi:RimM protein, required for 16S rRNA processing [Zymobacter palmae]|uniref:Ribosome maturation factor RimM n=2 Tax=Zymobacter palmae TaxID=33074 RepID=A0A348HC90_9GAMM|nr:RimM protein, required for 16S rRNA processing [Zymobacter palmae]
MKDTTNSKAPASDNVVMGHLMRPYGVKGWLWVYSHSNPMESILDYSEWIIEKGGVRRPVKVIQGRRQGKGVVVSLEGITTRELAESMANAQIMLPTSALPTLDQGDYYWYQLEGLQVITLEGVVLGKVDHLFETGANDVLVVTGGPDGRERLLPYLPDDVIREIDLEAGTMHVDWDPEF